MNYKGQYYDEKGNEIEEEKYTCPQTGAHFKYTDLILKLEKIAKERAKEQSMRVAEISPSQKEQSLKSKSIERPNIFLESSLDNYTLQTEISKITHNKSLNDTGPQKLFTIGHRPAQF